MEYLFIYGLQIADIINIIVIVCVAFLALAFLLAFPMLTAFSPDDLKQWWNLWIKKTITFLIVSPLILCMLPTKQTLLLIGGTYLGKKAVNAVATSDKLEKINTIIDLQLDKYIKELQKGE